MESHVIVNGQRINKDSSMLFGDLINSLNSELANRSLVISQIRINGKNLDESQESRFHMTQLGQIGAIEVVTTDPVELAFDALRTAQEYIRQIIPRCKKAAEHYRRAETALAEKEFIEIVDALDGLTDLLSSAQFVLKGKVTISLRNDSSLRLAQVRLISAIQELLPAKVQNDSTLLADILGNELPESLSEMSNLGIPVLLRLQSS